jgi:2-methylcitrate dehydratase PrpD
MQPVYFLSVRIINQMTRSLQQQRFAPIAEYINELRWQMIPADVKQMASRCLLDLCATLIAGSATELSQMARSVAAASFGGNEATLLVDGRKASAAGAALANGMTIDAMDLHDGLRPAKGHAGAGIFPAAVASGESASWDGEAFLTAVVVGYEVALRAGIALHQTACDYHTSGAWSALGAAAVASRALGLNTDQTRHALGIAEYHGPRSQMMRCIDFPTMLKDGSGWGSMAGVLAARLAAKGFTGAPAMTVEADQVAPIWGDLGSSWLMRDLYFKDYACCRWTQPAIEAVLELKRRYALDSSGIRNILVHTFEPAVHLDISRPENTEQAQYSLPYPVAAALIHGQLDPQQVLPPSIFEEEILELADAVKITSAPDLNAVFPEQALARVEIEMKDGRSFESRVHHARGDPEDGFSDVEIIEKFQRIAGMYLSDRRLKMLQDRCLNAAHLENVKELVELLTAPLEKIPRS